MKVWRVACLLLVIVGGVLVLDASTANLERNWTPLACPYPGSGFQIKGSFKITRETAYWLQVEVPDHLPSGVGLPEKPPLDCILHVKITSDSGTDEKTVKQFQYGGQVPAELVSLYTSDQHWNLKRGEYEVEISSEKTPGLVSTNGAIIDLEQIENPAGPILRNRLQFYGGGALAILGIVGLIASYRDQKPG